MVRMGASSFLVAFAMPLAAAPRVDPQSAVAQIAWPYEAKPRLVADDHVWRCTGPTCTGEALDRPASRMRTCRALARMGGRVISFTVGGVPMVGEELERCNRGLN